MARIRRWLVALIVVVLIAITAFSLWQWNANRTPESMTEPTVHLL
jgi:DNA-binding transcriptional regulator of glucitol operon